MQAKAAARRLPLDRHSGANRGYVYPKHRFRFSASPLSCCRSCGICCPHRLIILFSSVLVSREDLQFDKLKKSVACHWRSLRASLTRLSSLLFNIIFRIGLDISCGVIGLCHNIP